MSAQTPATPADSSDSSGVTALLAQWWQTLDRGWKSALLGLALLAFHLVDVPV